MRSVVLAAIGLIASLNAGASCWTDGTRTQAVWLSVDGKTLERWEPKAGDIHRVRLPASFELGIQIDPATAEKYRELFSRHHLQGVDELVKITLFDMSSSKAVEISTTWGGVNSKQGFGPGGGANGVAAMGDQIELWFHKPVCITSKMLEAKDGSSEPRRRP